MLCITRRPMWRCHLLSLTPSIIGTVVLHTIRTTNVTQTRGLIIYYAKIVTRGSRYTTQANVKQTKKSKTTTDININIKEPKSHKTWQQIYNHIANKEIVQSTN